MAELGDVVNNRHSILVDKVKMTSWDDVRILIETKVIGKCLVHNITCESKDKNMLETYILINWLMVCCK